MVTLVNAKRDQGKEESVINVGKELAILKTMTAGQLRERYAEVFGEQTRARHKEFLVKRIVWRLQSLEEGDLSERARRRAAELANDADIRLRLPKAPTGGAPERTCVAELAISQDTGGCRCRVRSLRGNIRGAPSW